MQRLFFSRRVSGRGVLRAAGWVVGVCAAVLGLGIKRGLQMPPQDLPDIG